MSRYNSNSNAVRSVVARVIRANLDLSKVPGLEASERTDFILLNPIKGKTPYVMLLLSDVVVSEYDKDGLLYDYTFSVEVYDEYKELLGSKPSVTYGLIDSCFEAVYNNRGSIKSDADGFRGINIKIGKSQFAKKIEPGNTKWYGFGKFTLTVGFK